MTTDYPSPIFEYLPEELDWKPYVGFEALKTDIRDPDGEVHRLLRLLVSEKRYRHSVSVAEMCQDFLDGYLTEIPLDEVYIAGLLHDCAKRIKGKPARRAMKELFPKYADFPEWTYHQFLGAQLAKDLFGVESEKVYDAICYHATGRYPMAILGRVLYASDKIDPLRGYDSQYMIDEMNRGVNHGFMFVLEENWKYYKKQGFKPDNPLTKECMWSYLGKK